MSPRFLLDTNILIRWLTEPKKLSRDQKRVVETASARGEPLALSAMTLLEIAILVVDEDIKISSSLADFLAWIEASPTFRIMPLTADIAIEAAAFRPLRDPADRAIAATARVHRLKLVTSDQRIIDSQLVPVIE